jgi:hypothetical protein
VTLNDVQRGYTWVDTEGDVIQLGRGGLVVCAAGTRTPLLLVDEVSDDETINLFLVAHNRAEVVRAENPGVATHELLLDRGDL